MIELRNQECLYPKKSHPSEKNGNWKGDKVGLHALHRWVKRRLLKPNNCSKCGEIKPLDCANISQKYKRDLSDWKWLCRKCHLTEDGRLARLNELGKINLSNYNLRKKIA